MLTRVICLYDRPQAMCPEYAAAPCIDAEGGDNRQLFKRWRDGMDVGTNIN